MASIEDFFADLNNIEWKTYDTLYALDSFRKYLKENERLIADAADVEQLRHGPDWKPKDQEEHAEYLAEMRAVRHLHDEIMVPIFRYSCLVMLCSIIEKELRTLAESLAKEKNINNLSYKDFKGSYLEQVNKFWEVIGIGPINNTPQYQQITNLQKIRDCIVHCNGEIALSRDKVYLLGIGKRSAGISCDPRIEIEQTYLDAAMGDVWVFFLQLFNRLGWKVNDNWPRK